MLRAPRLLFVSLFLVLGPGAMAFQMSAPRGSRDRSFPVCCTEPAPETAEPEAALLAEPGLKSSEDFTLKEGAKEMQRILVGTEFGLQVGAATLLFGGAMWWSTVALAEDPFWSSPIFPQ